MAEELPPVFKDDEGREWHPRVSAIAMIEAGENLRITMDEMLDRRMTMGDMLKMLWYCCKAEAAQKNISFNAFMAALGDARSVTAGLAAMSDAMSYGMPKADAQGGAGTGPFADGSGATSMS
uniref:Tail protein n=2 Tax=viral metagenome TaxID=1070528 RepID=A0A6M3KC32_9ZZZZ